jgi:SNW domain-containing protein 1
MTSLWLPAPIRTTTSASITSETKQQQGNQVVLVSNSTNSSNSNHASGISSSAINLTAATTKTSSSSSLSAPSYEERCEAAKRFAKLSPEQRKASKPLFVPRRVGDFEDGGAFPEIHVAQYPRNMGNPHLKQQQRGSASTSALVNVEVDEKGQVSYDAIVKGGTNTNKTVYTQHQHLRPHDPREEDLLMPSKEEEEDTTRRTQAAIEKMLSSTIAMAKPTGSAVVQAQSSQDIESKTQFIQYTPNPAAPGYNPATASQRVIQMVPAQIDPMMPPKHKHRKEPRGPAEDPVPVLHAPPAKLTKEEAAEWNVPACISNWKNTRGYVIPLDKRLAADGRGLREHTINPNFATLSETLYVAERQAREEVRLRATVQKKIAVKEKEKREEELRLLAAKARMERAGAFQTTNTHPISTQQQEKNQQQEEEMGNMSREVDRGVESWDVESTAPLQSEDMEQVNEEDRVAALQRERLRLERKKEREREMRLEKLKKPRRLEEERDVSEKIALGVHTGMGGVGGAIDTRLYNQSAGLDSGFGADDEYNMYSRPLFDRGAATSSIYKPTVDNSMDGDAQYSNLVKGATTKFQPDQGFSGAESSGTKGAPRSEPVQFEKVS